MTTDQEKQQLGTATNLPQSQSSSLILEKIQEAMRLIESLPKIESYRYQASSFLQDNEAYKIDAKAISLPGLRPTYDYLVIVSFPIAYKLMKDCPGIQINFPTPQEDKTFWSEIKRLAINCLETWSYSKWK